MPIDPNIALSGRPPQIIPPLEQAGKVMSLQGMLQERQLRNQQIQAVGLENQQRQTQMGAQKAIADLISQNTQVDPSTGAPVTNHAAVMQGLASRGYGDAAIKYDADRRANEKAQVENAQNQLKLAKDKADQFASLLGGVQSAPDDQKPAAYAQARTQAIQRGLIKPTDAPDTFDPSFVQQHHDAALTAQNQIEQHQKDLDYHLRLSEFNQKVATEQPKTLNAWLENAGQILGQANTQDQWTAGMNNLKTMGAPDTVLSQFSPMFSVDQVKKAANLGMTPQQRQSAELAGQRVDILGQRVAQGEERIKQGEERTDILQQRLDLTKEKQENPTLTPQQQEVQDRQKVRNLAARVYNDSLKGGGASIDDVIKNIQNPKYYVNDEVDDYRPQIIAQLNAWKAADLKPDQIQAQISKSSKGGSASQRIMGMAAWQADHPGKPLPKDVDFATYKSAPQGSPSTVQAAGKPAQPASPTQPTPAKPQAAPAKPTAKFTEADVRARAQAKGVDPEAAVKLARDKGLIQ